MNSNIINNTQKHKIQIKQHNFNLNTKNNFLKKPQENKTNITTRIKNKT